MYYSLRSIQQTPSTAVPTTVEHQMFEYLYTNHTDANDSFLCCFDDKPGDSSPLLGMDLSIASSCHIQYPHMHKHKQTPFNLKYFYIGINFKTRPFQSLDNLFFSRSSWYCSLLFGVGMGWLFVTYLVLWLINHSGSFASMDISHFF